MDKFLKIENLNPFKFEELEDLLVDLNIKYSKYNNAFNLFCQEEAEAWLENYEFDEDFVIKNKELRDEIVFYISRVMFKSETFINGEAAEEIVLEAIEEYRERIEEDINKKK